MVELSLNGIILSMNELLSSLTFCQQVGKTKTLGWPLPPPTPLPQPETT